LSARRGRRGRFRISRAIRSERSPAAGVGDQAQIPDPRLHVGHRHDRRQLGLELFTIAAGVPLGAASPMNPSTTTPSMPASASVGTSGNSGRRVAPVEVSGRSVPAVQCDLPEPVSSYAFRQPALPAPRLESITVCRL